MKPKFPKREKLEIIIVLVVFAASFLFPFCTFYFEGKSETHIIEKPQYINTFLFGYIYMALMVVLLAALFSARRIIVNLLNILVLIFLLLLYLILMLQFNWWGASPYHPTLGAGFILVNIILVYFIFRSFFWIDSVIRSSNKTRLRSVVGVSVPVIFVLTIVYLINKMQNEAIRRTDSINRNEGIHFLDVENNRIEKQETWDYIEAYDGFATKYYSKPVSDSLKNTFVLDSVRFSFTDSSPKSGDAFTVLAKDGDLDIEQVFENYLR